MDLESALSMCIDRIKRDWLGSRRPLVVGICGPQACGKSTACGLLASRDTRLLHLSLDDFYMSNSQLLEMHRASGDPLYEFRGNPGTHDIEALKSALSGLQRREAFRVPVYDKAALDGRGDQIGVVWKKGPYDLVLLEGWMLGFLPTENAPASLRNVNEKLRDYLPIYAALDLLIVITIPNILLAREWRLASGGLPQKASVEFVDNFMPACNCYYPDVESSFRRRYPNVPVLVLQMQSDRTVIFR